jgi:hypothetical protein
MIRACALLMFGVSKRGLSYIHMYKNMKIQKCKKIRLMDLPYLMDNASH